MGQTLGIYVFLFLLFKKHSYKVSSESTENEFISLPSYTVQGYVCSECVLICSACPGLFTADSIASVIYGKHLKSECFCYVLT
jgi:hypothetical protein